MKSFRKHNIHNTVPASRADCMCGERKITRKGCFIMINTRAKAIEAKLNTLFDNTGKAILNFKDGRKITISAAVLGKWTGEFAHKGEEILSTSCVEHLHNFTVYAEENLNATRFNEMTHVHTYGINNAVFCGTARDLIYKLARYEVIAKYWSPEMAAGYKNTHKSDVFFGTTEIKENELSDAVVGTVVKYEHEAYEIDTCDYFDQTTNVYKVSMATTITTGYALVLNNEEDNVTLLDMDTNELIMINPQTQKSLTVKKAVAK